MSKRIHNSIKATNYKQTISCNTVTGAGQNKKNVLTSNIGSCDLSSKRLYSTFNVARDHNLNRLRVTDILYANSIYHENNYQLLPPGLIMQYSGNPANPPGGWLLCDGSAVSKLLYPCLYEVIGSIYAPETVTEFYLPDLRGRVIVGTGTGPGLSARALGDVGGEEDHTLVIAEMPSHTHPGTTDNAGDHVHNVNDPGHSHANNTNNTTQGLVIKDGSGTPGSIDTTPTEINCVTSPVALTITSTITGITLSSAGNHNHTFVTNAVGGGQPHNNMQPYLVVNYIIKY